MNHATDNDSSDEAFSLVHSECDSKGFIMAFAKRYFLQITFARLLMLLVILSRVCYICNFS
jgi:hypothetical protein